MAHTPDSVLKDLKQGNYAPVYFLQGEETYYIDKIATYIEQEVLGEAERGFNQTVLYGRDVNMAAVVNTARRFPVMAQHQVVIVKEAQEMPDWNQEKGRDLISRYCEQAPPSTILVFCYKYKKLDARTQLAKTLAKHAVVVESKKLYDNQVPAWVKNLIAGLGHEITEKAVAMLCESVGNDLSRIASEIEKLLINFSGKTTINEDHIARYVGISKEYNTFELQSALARKESTKVFRIVHYFEGNPRANPVIPIIALLFGYFSKLMLLHDSADKSKQGVAATLGINPFFADEYLLAARNYPLAKVYRVMYFLHQADLQSKGIDSNMDDGEILKELVFKILNG